MGFVGFFSYLFFSRSEDSHFLMGGSDVRNSMLHQPMLVESYMLLVFGAGEGLGIDGCLGALHYPDISF